MTANTTRTHDRPAKRLQRTYARLDDVEIASLDAMCRAFGMDRSGVIRFALSHLDGVVRATKIDPTLEGARVT